ncbi:hypothetical protein O181_131805 [Austropuccinia psidii MF-1]|uniref:Uncharacterized protein n=1 Tax=Austropuccinia psidii MF-1 TaxID=1389203 RepID=A0A9Q3L622_9BASI|nr:hypothetical protein [Austropuccinia psidii MF-1]
MHPVLKVAGVVHIWYYIPLCTIFAQQFNGDAFRTKFHDSKSRSQNPTPILKEDSSAHQSGNPSQRSEDYSRTTTTWPYRSWVKNYFRIIPRAILRGYSSFNQLSRQQILQYSLDNSIGPYRQESIIPVCPWPNEANLYSTVGIQSHSSILKMARAGLAQFRKYSGDSPSRISLSAFHIYGPPFITWGLFPQLINILDLFFIFISLFIIEKKYSYSQVSQLHLSPSPVSGYWWSYPLLIPFPFLEG